MPKTDFNRRLGINPYKNNLTHLKGRSVVAENKYLNLSGGLKNDKR